MRGAFRSLIRVEIDVLMNEDVARRAPIQLILRLPPRTIALTLEQQPIFRPFSHSGSYMYEVNYVSALRAARNFDLSTLPDIRIGTYILNSPLLHPST